MLSVERLNIPQMNLHLDVRFFRFTAVDYDSYNVSSQRNFHVKNWLSKKIV
jgi:hypothetical protein